MAESSLWGTLRKNMRGYGHWVRIENKVEKGTPDVNGCFNHNGKGVDVWIELKSLREWPVRATTCIRLPHFTKEQKQWLLDRAEAGGRAFLFVRVEREYFLFSAARAQVVEQLTREQWYKAARAHYTNRVTWDHFRSILAWH